MQRFVQFRLGCHGLPIAAGRFAGAAHVDRAHRVCLACNSGAVGNEKHLVFECTALASLRSRYAGLFTGSTDTMRSFLAQPDHMGVFHYVVDCLDFMDDLNMIAMIGTSDRPCWLAEACKILHLGQDILLFYVYRRCRHIVYRCCRQKTMTKYSHVLRQVPRPARRSPDAFSLLCSTLS